MTTREFESTGEVRVRIRCEGGLGPMLETACALRWRIANGRDDGSVALSPSRKCIDCPHGKGRSEDAAIAAELIALPPFPNLIGARRISHAPPAAGAPAHHQAPPHRGLGPRPATPAPVVDATPAAISLADARVQVAATRKRKCEWGPCQTTFVRRYSKRFCSPEHHRLYVSQRATDLFNGVVQPAVQRTHCAIETCGKPIPPRLAGTRGKPRSYCSKPCAKQAYLARQREQYAEVTQQLRRALPQLPCAGLGCKAMIALDVGHRGRRRLCDACRAQRNKRHVFNITDDLPVIVRVRNPANVFVQVWEPRPPVKAEATQ